MSETTTFDATAYFTGTEDYRLRVRLAEWIARRDSDRRTVDAIASGARRATKREARDAAESLDYAIGHVAMLERMVAGSAS